MDGGGWRMRGWTRRVERGKGEREGRRATGRLNGVRGMEGGWKGRGVESEGKGEGGM